jgi:hypothetical protein
LITTKYDQLGKKIENLFPLLDPELDLPTAITRHKESSNAKNQFITATGEAFMKWIVKEMNQVGRNNYISDLIQGYPLVMPFIPT